MNAVNELELPAVALVDDDAMQLRLMAATVGRLGYRAVSINSPLGATNIIRAVNPVLVVVDINMPALDGRELVKLLRGHPRTRSTPVLFMSAQPREEIEAAVRDTGANGYIQKGASLEAIIAGLRLHLTPPTAQPAAPAPTRAASAQPSVGKRRTRRRTYMAAWSLEAEPSRKRLMASVTNLSLGGMALYTDASLAPGTRVTVCLAAQDLGEELCLQGDVRWRRSFGEQHGLGIAFVPGSSAAHQALAGLLLRLPDEVA